jgi:hypothetical protein
MPAHFNMPPSSSVWREGLGMMTQNNVPAARSKTFHSIPAVLSATSLMLALIGCTNISIPYSGTPPTPSYQNLTGNWQIAVTAQSGPVPFTSLAGFIQEGTTLTSTGYSVTASLQLAQPSSCYTGAGTALIPAAGQYLGTALGLYSFTFDGQYLDTTSTVNSTGTQFTGTYVIEDGCAGALSSQGTIVGTRYANLTGTYTGPITGTTPNETLALALTQSDTGNGDGTSTVTGTATLTGLAFACFTQGPLASSPSPPNPPSYVLGSAAQLVFTDPTTNVQVTMVGTFDPTADTLTLSSINVSGGPCAGSLGTATLKL